MEIKLDTDHSFDFKPLIEQSALSSTEKDQISELFQKIQMKGKRLKPARVLDRQIK